MKFLKIIFFSYVLMRSASLHATPEKIEMIFLSPQKITSLLRSLDQLERIKLAAFTAQNDDKCVPMGDGCFHPQLGYIEKKSDSPKPVAMDPVNEVKTFNSLETSLINCDKNNHFDIYCGQETKDQPLAKTEVWLDISSSLREVDYSNDQTECGRKTFVKNMIQLCKQNIRFSVYNTVLKELGDHSTACLAHGTNNADKLVRWIKESNAKHLLLVTDIDELSPALKEILEENGAKLMGDGTKPFTTKDLIEYAKEFSKHCN